MSLPDFAFFFLLLFFFSQNHLYINSVTQRPVSRACRENDFIKKKKKRKKKRKEKRKERRKEIQQTTVAFSAQR